MGHEKDFLGICELVKILCIHISLWSSKSVWTKLELKYKIQPLVNHYLVKLVFNLHFPFLWGIPPTSWLIKACTQSPSLQECRESFSPAASMKPTLTCSLGFCSLPIGMWIYLLTCVNSLAILASPPLPARNKTFGKKKDLLMWTLLLS